MDDSLVYSNTPAEHLRHLRTVFDTLRQHRLFAKLSKCCSFFQTHVDFLGYVVGPDGQHQPQENCSTTSMAFPILLKGAQIIFRIGKFL